MRLANFTLDERDAPRLGVLGEGVVVEVDSPHWPPSVDAYLSAAPDHQSLVRDLAAAAEPRDGHASDAVRFLPPVLAPGKVIAAIRNFHSHHAESLEGWGRQGVEIQYADVPRAFIKARSTLVGHRSPVYAPRWIKGIDYESELVAVIGRRADNVSVEEALDYVAGYTVANDFSARDLQLAEMRNGGSPLVGKNPRTFGPMGPALVTADEIGDPQNLRIWSTVNGELRQNGTTADMIFSVAQLVSWYSQAGLDIGDMIMSGTPAGVALWSEKPMLSPGDVVVCGVDGVGTLENAIVAVAEGDNGVAQGAEAAWT